MPLNQNQLNNIANEIMLSIGYENDVRTLLLANISPAFKNLFQRAANPLFQLNLDLLNLNGVDKLSDGTNPLELWLAQAAYLAKPYPSASDTLQKALSTITAQGMSNAKVTNIIAPTQATIGKVNKEKILFKNAMVPYSFLQQGYEKGMSVGRMTVERFNNKQPAKLPDGSPVIYLGTGWLLTKDLIITNHHVINARNDGEPDASTEDFNLQAKKSAIEFDFNSQNAAGISIKVSALEASDNRLDYCILRLATNTNRVPLSMRKEAILADNNNVPVVNIIQHPRGLPKSVAIRNNHIFEANFPTVRYFTDTEGGSSGSPVFNDAWQVVALHRASVVVDNVNYNGQATSWINEGVQIKAVLDHLEQHFPALNAEITA